MDWTQIVLAIIATTGTISTVVLPITLTRSHKKTRHLASDDTAAITARIESVEGSVKELCTQMKANNITTQGLHLLDVIEHRPHCWETIRSVFAAYRAAGGNSHVERVYNQWEADFGAYYDAGEVPPSLMTKRRATAPKTAE